MQTYGILPYIRKYGSEATGLMDTAVLNIRMPRDVKDRFERACDELGMSMTTAVNVFARTVAREQRIPFEVTSDPFWSEENQAHLRRSFAQLDSGRYTVHELDEADGD